MNLTNYFIAKTPQLPPPSATLYEYILGAGGLYLRAKRRGLSVIAPLASVPIIGLEEIQPQFQLDYPQVPAQLLQQILSYSQQVAPQEILFHLWFERGEWQLDIPLQKADSLSVSRLGSSFASSYHKTLIEIHSHHSTEAKFSPTDDQDESGFRIYAVLGTIFTQPTLRVRVGIYHQLFWEIPAHFVFEMPPKIQDVLDNNSR